METMPKIAAVVPFVGTDPALEALLVMFELTFGAVPSRADQLTALIHKWGELKTGEIIAEELQKARRADIEMIERTLKAYGIVPEPDPV